MTEFKPKQSRREPKICGVCGHKAIGKNFGAVTCEPCKAFFRRNALKNTFECLFEGMCPINEVTRKFCQKCRLTKCFEIGMKREFILNDEERHFRRLKLEAKRRQRKGSGETIATPATPHPSSSGTASPDETMTSFYSQYSETISDSSDISFAVNTGVDTNNEYSMLSVTPLPSISPITNTTANLLDTDFFAYDNYGEQLVPIGDNDHQLLEIGTIDRNNNNNHSFTAADDTDIADDVYEKVVQFELSIIPIATDSGADSTPFNDSERKVLRELLDAVHSSLIECPKTSSVTEIVTLHELRQTMGYIWEREIQMIVAFMKSLQSFQRLCETDRIALLKNSSFEVLYLLSIIRYNPADDCITLPMDLDNSVVINMDLLKQTKRNIYGVLTNYYNKMLPILDSDRVILHLLSAIVVFNPDKDNIIHREAIKIQQNIYMHLLKRYLSIKYRTECESKTRFLRLMNTLQDISLLGKIQRENTTETFAEMLPPPYVFPLIREIIM